MGFLYKKVNKRLAQIQEIASVGDFDKIFTPKSRNDVKKAGVTIEVILAISLAVIVLFLVLGLFGKNLKTMVAKGGMNNLFKSSATMDDSEKWNADYNQPGRQINVQVTADPDALLVQKHQEIVDAINKILKDSLSNNPPGSLTDAQKKNLAMELTKLAQSVKGVEQMSVLTQQITGGEQGSTKYSSYYDLANQNGIRFNFNTTTRNSYIPPYTTSVDGKEIPWGQATERSGVIVETNSQSRLNVISDIETEFAK